MVTNEGDTTRLEMFSDGVMAIAITLLANRRSRTPFATSDDSRRHRTTAGLRTLNPWIASGAARSSVHKGCW